MILVTGAAGYIGSHFLRLLLRAGFERKIIAVDDLSCGHREALPQDPRVVPVFADIGNFELMKDLMLTHKVEAVVHFAGSCYVGESEKDPFKYYRNNLANTINLLESMNESGCKRIVFSSSCATYGNPDFLPINETHPQKPINIYGQTKLMIEDILFNLRRTSGLSFMALRYFNAAGADPYVTGSEYPAIGESHDPETHLIPNALKAAAGSLDCLEIYGDDYDTRDGTCIRDYIHVNDLCRAHISALDILFAGEAAEGINLGSGRGASVKEIVDLVEKISGRKLKSSVLPRRPGDPAELLADYSKAERLLSWKPEHDLESIIETAWHWQENRRY